MADETKNDKEGTGYPDPTGALKELIDAGVFYGRPKSKTHPRMKSYDLATRGGVEIVNLERTVEGMERAAQFLKERVAKGDQAIIAGTQPEAEQEVLALADRQKISSVTNRWLGGTLTNFKIILDRLNYWKKLRENLAGGAYAAYTKKERLEIEREIERLRELFGGIERMAKRPDVLIVLDPHIHKTAVREAHRIHIPVIAFANLDSDPDEVDYLVVGNTKSRSSNRWFLSKIEAALEEGMRMRATIAAAAESAKQDAEAAPKV